MAFSREDNRGGQGQGQSSQNFDNNQGKKVFFRQSKACPLSEKGAPKVDYKDVKLLAKFISERGKMMPRRITSISAKKQRALAKAIKRARNLALLPFVSK